MTTVRWDEMRWINPHHKYRNIAMRIVRHASLYPMPIHACHVHVHVHRMPSDAITYAIHVFVVITMLVIMLECSANKCTWSWKNNRKEKQEKGKAQKNKEIHEKGNENEMKWNAETAVEWECHRLIIHQGILQLPWLGCIERKRNIEREMQKKKKGKKVKKKNKPENASSIACNQSKESRHVVKLFTLKWFVHLVLHNTNAACC